jgi:hypothetical protein
VRCMFSHKITDSLLVVTPMGCAFLVANPLPVNGLGARLAECSTSA